MKKLDAAFGSLATKLNTILVGGTNGKSLSINFMAQLLREEGLNVGTFYAPHMLTYNERLPMNTETISNKTFTDIANEVINMAESQDLTPNSFEILTMMALVYFKNSDVDVAILEVSEGGAYNATSICVPKIAAVTRVTADKEEATPEFMEEVLGVVKSGTHVVSADQSKLNLQAMHNFVDKKGGIWSMPIRKLAPLPYPYEQLHGRCAALAERIAQIYINAFCAIKCHCCQWYLVDQAKRNPCRPTLEAETQCRT